MCSTRNLFVSHAGADRAWAEWAAWQLSDAGYSVELDLWDWAAGQNFITKMNAALNQADRVVALFSSAYFERERYTSEEWKASLVHVPGVAEDRLVPVRVENVTAEATPPLLRPLIACDVFGLSREQARQALLQAVAGPHRPEAEPPFPGGPTPGYRLSPEQLGLRLPGVMPEVWRVPARNTSFVGRDRLLVQIRETLLSGGRTVVQALHGLGGVGKTQLAIEYAHEFASSYDVVWWVNAEEPGLIGAQLALLAQEMGCADLSAELETARRALLGKLRQMDRWLLIFDNVSRPDDLEEWLPGGSGHVLTTARIWDREETALPVQVDVMAHTESIAVLMSRVPGLSEAEASRVAAALGNLPLALAQAAGYMSGTGTSAQEYLDLLTSRSPRILDLGASASHPRSLTAVTQLAFDQLSAANEAAAQAITISSFLAPEPVPAVWFTRAAARLPEPLAHVAADPIAWRQALSVIRGQALALLDQQGLLVHRLTQAIIRSHLSQDVTAAARDHAAGVLVANHPGDGQLPSTWPGWARLLPHLLTLDPDASTPNLSDLTYGAAWYLIRSGEARDVYELVSRLYEHRLSQAGPDAPGTLNAATTAAIALHTMGRYEEARKMNEETLMRRRRLLGDDHLSTLISATCLASDLSVLRNHQAARELSEDTYARYRRILGDDHPSTLISASGLAAHLRALGDKDAARELNEDTHTRRRRTLGDDHPSTLSSATCLASDLSALGDHQAARELNEETLARRRQVLGDGHPDTLISASNLAENLHALGDHQAARELNEETLARRRQVLGDDHPDTLTSASNLAENLHALGDHQAAHELNEDTLLRKRRNSGGDHPSSPISASNLVADLRALGET